jgi:hypothetical protein
MTFVTSTVLNIASGIMVLLMVSTGVVREDYVRPFLILYAIGFLILLAVPDGGQINAAIAIGLVLQAVLTSVSKETDKRTSDFIESKRSTYIISGILNAHSSADQSFTTYDKTSSSYRPVARSVNRYGGAQFSVTGWLYIKGAIGDDQVSGKTLFMRGDKTKYAPMFTATGDTAKTAYFGTEDGKDYAIVCPRIFFPTGKNCSNKLRVSINTDRQLVHTFEIGSDDMSLDLRKNALSLIPNSWAMFAFTFEDAYDLSSFEKGIRMRFYIGDTLYSEQTVIGSLRMNNGPVHILPGASKDTSGIPDAHMADWVWHNWALSPGEVSRLYAMGFSQDSADSDAANARTLQLNAYNKIDTRANLDSHIFRNRPVAV